MARLTPEEARVDNAFRRLNRRLQTAFNSLGPDSEVYSKLESYALSLGVRGATVMIDRNGVPRLVRNKVSLGKLANSNIAHNITVWLDSHTDTKTEVANISAQLRSSGGMITVTRAEFKEMVKARAAAERQARETIHQNLALLYDYEHQSDFIDDILSDWAKGTGRKTYDDIVALAEAADKLKKEISKGNITQAPPKSPFD